ncbi:IS5 family transposase [Rhizobium sp. C1]|uniref:IS5 family transposase n=1 Tax=Rhizobium sp. C1 TaxID=1349799 RepID=UPI003FA757E4
MLKLPRNAAGARRVDDRRVISGIIHVLQSGCRWQDCPSQYGPPTTIYNRFHRWSGRRVWHRILAALVAMDGREFQAIDSTTAKAHRSAGGGKGADAQAIGRSRGGRTTKIHAVVDAKGRPLAFEITPGQLGDVRAALALIAPLPPAKHLAADAAYDSNGLRQFLTERGTLPVIPNNPTRRRFHPFDKLAYKARNIIERMFCRLKDWRRIATRYDKLAANFSSAVAIAAVIIWWAN